MGIKLIDKIFIFIKRVFGKSEVRSMATALYSDVANKLEKIAWTLREKTFQTDYYAEVILIARRLGLSVYDVAFENNSISGYIEIDEDIPQNNKICVNKSHCDERKRFTIAHEIGHYVLDHLNSDCKRYRRVDYDNGDNTAQESQANKFAAILLMPKDMVKEIWIKFHDIQIVAATFGVSVESASYRINNLKLV